MLIHTMAILWYSVLLAWNHTRVWSFYNLHVTINFFCTFNDSDVFIDQHIWLSMISLFFAWWWAWDKNFCMQPQCEQCMRHRKFRHSAYMYFESFHCCIEKVFRLKYRCAEKINICWCVASIITSRWLAIQFTSLTCWSSIYYLFISDAVAVYPRSLRAKRKKKTPPDRLKFRRNCIKLKFFYFYSYFNAFICSWYVSNTYHSLVNFQINSTYCIRSTPVYWSRLGRNCDGTDTYLPSSYSRLRVNICSIRVPSLPIWWRH